MACNDLNHSQPPISGSFTDICTDGGESSIRADIVVSESDTVRVWGQVRSLCGRPAPGILLKLVKVFIEPGGSPRYEGVAHTTSDCNGIYQFELCRDSCHSHYRIFAGAAVAGCECALPACEVCDGPCPGQDCCRCIQPCMMRCSPCPNPDPCAPPIRRCAPCVPADCVCRPVPRQCL